MKDTRRLLFLVVTEDWYLASHRLPLIRAARDARWRVLVATRIRDHANPIRESGAELVPIPFAREGRNPLGEVVSIARLAALYRHHRPDIVHHVAIKPVLYGSLAARLAGGIPTLNALAGMGFLKGEALAHRALRAATRMAVHARLSLLLVQHADDAEFGTRMLGLDPARVRCVSGSGVDLEQFHPTPEPNGVPLVVLPARMLRAKGVLEFSAAAAHLRDKGSRSRFVLAGRIDSSNPDSLDEQALRRLESTSPVKWIGNVADMPALLRDTSIVVLPSYQEGIPKVLLEAAASARAIITTDIPGCRDVVRDGINGLLVPPRDPTALAEAIRTLLADPQLRTQMGRQGRRRAEAEFSDHVLAEQTIAVYEELLALAAQSRSPRHHGKAGV